jgi:hypothetical protein
VQRISATTEHILGRDAEVAAVQLRVQQGAIKQLTKKQEL